MHLTNSAHLQLYDAESGNQTLDTLRHYANPAPLGYWKCLVNKGLCDLFLLASYLFSQDTFNYYYFWF